MDNWNLKDLIDLGATAVVAIVGFLVLYRMAVTKKRNGNGNDIVPAIKELGGNHIQHLYDEVVSQGVSNREFQRKSTEQHEKQIELLTILTTLIRK